AMHRRQFIRRGAVAAALFGIPPAQAEQGFGDDPPRLPPKKLFKSDPDRYWAELRRQWLLAADRINLNCGSVGCTPLPVLRAVIDHLLAAEAFRDADYPWFGYDENKPVRELRDAPARLPHRKPHELALTRNATEGNNIVCNGLDLKPGDEVLLTDQEHPGGRCCWEQKAERFGVKLKFFELPRPPKSADEILDRFTKALTPKTRLAF